MLVVVASSALDFVEHEYVEGTLKLAFAFVVIVYADVVRRRRSVPAKGDSGLSAPGPESLVLGDEMPAVVAGVAWEPNALPRIAAILDDAAAGAASEAGGATREQVGHALARFLPLVRVRLEDELGDGTSLRAEALFVLAQARLAQLGGEIVPGDREQVFISILNERLGMFAREQGAPIAALGDDAFEQAVNECAAVLQLSPELGRELARRNLGRP